MQLIYLDESGNTGTNLDDAQQPVFLLAALIVPEEQWLDVEKQLLASLNSHFPSRNDDFEVHATDIRRGEKGFKGLSLKQRIDFRNEWLDIAAKEKLQLVARKIEKSKFKKFALAEWGSGISVNPYVPAFGLVTRVVDDLLQVQKKRGMLIVDENKHVIDDVDKALKMLRAIPGPIKLGQIIEKGLFIDSKKSLVMQLCDVCTLTIRKSEEKRLGLKSTPFDDEGESRVRSLLYTAGDEKFKDVLQALKDQMTKK